MHFMERVFSMAANPTTPSPLGHPEPIDLPACPPDREARTHALLQAFDERVLVMDGATGTALQRLDLTADEPLHDVEIVNHQIKDDINVERARGEFADAMNLKIEGLADVRAQCDERRIEAFEVADLQERAAPPGGLDHPIGFFEGA